MSKMYGIFFDPLQDATNLEEFFEVIRSTFVSKKGDNYYFIVSASTDFDAQRIHELIGKKVKNKIRFTVAHINSFYGNSLPEFFNWVVETFPDKVLFQPIAQTEDPN